MLRTARWMGGWEASRTYARGTRFCAVLRGWQCQATVAGRRVTLATCCQRKQQQQHMAAPVHAWRQSAAGGTLTGPAQQQTSSPAKQGGGSGGAVKRITRQVQGAYGSGVRVHACVPRTSTAAQPQSPSSARL